MKMLFLTQRYAHDATAEDLTYDYLVTKVVNSIVPAVGTTLDNEKADEYCGDGDWKVTIS